MSIKHLLLATLLALASLPVRPSGATGAPALSLREAISRTLAHNPELADFPLQWRARQSRVDAAALKPAPRLSLEVENLLGTGTFQGLDSVESTLSLSQLFELGGRRDHRIEVARRGLDTLEVQKTIAQLDALAEVSRRFVHVAADEKTLELASLATTLAGNTVTALEQRVRSARSPEVELHRARIALLRKRVEQEHAEHELLSSRRALAAMWGERRDDFGPVQAELFRLPEIGDERALFERLVASPDLLQFATEARRREAEIRLAEARAQAPLTVAAGVRGFSGSDDVAFVAGISMPLFGARQAQADIAEARAQRERVDGARYAARVRAEASLFALIQELRHSLTEAALLRDEVLPQMDAALRETERAWQNGRYSYLEWTEAQGERIEVQRELIEASAHAHRMQIEIERLTGHAAADLPPTTGARP